MKNSGQWLDKHSRTADWRTMYSWQCWLLCPWTSVPLRVSYLTEFWQVIYSVKALIIWSIPLSCAIKNTAWAYAAGSRRAQDKSQNSSGTRKQRLAWALHAHAIHENLFLSFFSFFLLHFFCMGRGIATFQRREQLAENNVNRVVNLGTLSRKQRERKGDNYYDAKLPIMHGPRKDLWKLTLAWLAKSWWSYETRVWLLRLWLRVYNKSKYGLPDYGGFSWKYWNWCDISISNQVLKRWIA